MSEPKPQRSLADYQREAPQRLTSKEFIAQEQAMSDINLREKMVNTLLRIYSLLIAVTVIIFLLQGFKLGGFNLPEELLRWLGIATVGEVGGLAALVYGSLFRKPS